MPQLEQSSLQPSTVLHHRHLLQTTSYNHLPILHHLISRKEKSKQQQARNPLSRGVEKPEGPSALQPTTESVCLLSFYFLVMTGCVCLLSFYFLVMTGCVSVLSFYFLVVTGCVCLLSFYFLVVTGCVYLLSFYFLVVVTGCVCLLSFYFLRNSREETRATMNK